MLYFVENTDSITKSKHCEARNVDKRGEGSRWEGQGEKTGEQVSVPLQRSADSRQEKEVGSSQP